MRPAEHGNRVARIANRSAIRARLPEKHFKATRGNIEMTLRLV
jgi:hypothetical protein